MIEFLVAIYLILSLPATLLIWTALVASRRVDDKSQSIQYKSLEHSRFFNSKTKSINLHLS
jgi:hypothetical protein